MPILLDGDPRKIANRTRIFAAALLVASKTWINFHRNCSSVTPQGGQPLQYAKNQRFWTRSQPIRAKITRIGRFWMQLSTWRLRKSGPFSVRSSLRLSRRPRCRSVVAARRARSLRSSRALRVSRALLPQRHAIVRRAAPPSVPARNKPTLTCSHLAAPPPVRRCIFLLRSFYHADVARALIIARAPSTTKLDHGLSQLTWYRYISNR